MVSIYSFATTTGKPLSLPDIDDEDHHYNDDDEDVGVYLEPACTKCLQSSKYIDELSEKLETLQSLLAHREHHLKYLQDATNYLERKSEHQEMALNEMRKYREIVLKELSDKSNQVGKLTRENEKLLKELNSKPENPPIPPPPPPPPNTLLRFLPWKNDGKKPRSKSMSRIEGRKKPMILTDDILDAIRNKKYSLRKVEPPMLGTMRIMAIDNDSSSSQMIARLIQRRVRMEYSDNESEDDRSYTNVGTF